MPGTIDLQHSNGITAIRINHPEKRNALNRAMMAALEESIRHASREAKVLVLTGSASVFTAGADLDELTQSSADLKVEAGLARAAYAIENAPVPVVAAIEGACLGAGVELAAACDVRVAGEGAFFEIPANRLGLLYRPDGIERLLTAAGRQLLSRLLLLNERLDAQEAYGTGFIGQLVPPGEAFDVAMTIAAHATTLVSESVAATKRLIGEVVTGRAADTDWDAVRRRLLDG